MTAQKYYYNLNRCINDGKTQFDTTNMPKETYEVNGQIYHGSNDLMDLLNEQHETIERLKQNIDELMQLDVEEDLLKENKELKQSNERLLKMLDNVANYMQKENKYMPIDDFVEWWNRIATKGLDGGDLE